MLEVLFDVIMSVTAIEYLTCIPPQRFVLLFHTALQAFIYLQATQQVWVSTIPIVVVWMLIPTWTLKVFTLSANAELRWRELPNHWKPFPWMPSVWWMVRLIVELRKQRHTAPKNSLLVNQSNHSCLSYSIKIGFTRKIFDNNKLVVLQRFA